MRVRFPDFTARTEGRICDRKNKYGIRRQMDISSVHWVGQDPANTVCDVVGSEAKRFASPKKVTNISYFI